MISLMMDTPGTKQSTFSLASCVRSKSNSSVVLLPKERQKIISVQGQTISCLIGNICIKSDEDLAHNLILKVENEFSRRSYSISWHPGLSCLPATAKGTDVVSVRGRNERTSELTGSFWRSVKLFCLCDVLYHENSGVGWDKHATY